MTNELKVRTLDSSSLQADFEKTTKDHIAVKLRDLFTDTVLPFRIVFPLLETSKTLRLKILVEEGQIYNNEIYTVLTNKGIREVYLPKDREEAFISYLNSNIQRLTQTSSIPSQKKTQLLYDNAENVVRKLFREKPSRSTINLGKQLVENVVAHLSVDNITVEALFSLFSKDYYTFTHMVQVALLGMAFARHLGWSHDEVADFGLGALFHDIGKSSVDDSILNKPSSLSKEEFDIMKKHTLLGYQKLKDTQIMTKDQLDIVLHHHEAMDGSGYPERLKSNEIHKFSRMARIIDVYDALTTKRVYKDALSVTEALNIMNKNMLQTFDQELLNAFTHFLGMEEIVQQSSKGTRINIELGNQMLVQFSDEELRFKAVLIGMEESEYLILRLKSGSNLSQKSFHSGARMICRYVHMGTVYGFWSRIVAHILKPFSLLFISYPDTIEVVNLRQHPRIDCFLPGEITIEETAYPAVILDISIGGCRVIVKPLAGAPLPPVEIDATVGLSTQLLVEKRSEPFMGKVRNTSIEEGKLTLGIIFVDLDEHAKNSLNRFIENVLTIVRA